MAKCRVTRTLEERTTSCAPQQKLSIIVTDAPPTSDARPSDTRSATDKWLDNAMLDEPGALDHLPPDLPFRYVQRLIAEDQRRQADAHPGRRETITLSAARLALALHEHHGVPLEHAAKRAAEMFRGPNGRPLSASSIRVTAANIAEPYEISEELVKAALAGMRLS